MSIPFDKNELCVVDIAPGDMRNPTIEEYNYPVSKRVALRAAVEGKPVWLPDRFETQEFSPRILPDNVVRGMVCDGEPFDKNADAGGTDMFGVEWVYVPVAGGSMEKPGNSYLLENVNDWKRIISFPNIYDWDWNVAAIANKNYIDSNRSVQVTILSGWFERLISFMGFENAATSLLDEDQIDSVKELMLALTDLYIDIVDSIVKYFPDVDNFLCHDDWGSQVAPFFSKDIAANIFVPAMKKLTDHIHKIGCYAVLHS